MHVVKHKFFGNFKKHPTRLPHTAHIYTYITDYNNIHIMEKFDKVIDVGISASTNKLSPRA